MRSRARGGTQFVGHIPQQLTLAANQALQTRAHAVEVPGQYAELVAPIGQARQAVLLIAGLAQIVYGAAQAAQRTGDGQGYQQAEQGQHHQGNGQGAEGPGQAVAVPGIQLRMGDAVDEQIGIAGGRAGVFRGQAAPGQVAVVVVLPGLEGGGAARESPAYHRVAALIEDLDIDVVLALALLEDVLGGVFALGFVGLRPLRGEAVEPRMATEDPGVLVEHVPEQDRQPGNQGDGQPETGQDAPEQ
ncbi:deoxyguanosinetriphosphate triphosphohydrolase [Pseudomonas sp. Os17]|nr:deoxyguanosinetriphosphate triphosphohydrolase [Pseudomonas sp. Os17]